MGVKIGIQFFGGRGGSWESPTSTYSYWGVSSGGGAAAKADDKIIESIINYPRANAPFVTQNLIVDGQKAGEITIASEKAYGKPNDVDVVIQTAINKDGNTQIFAGQRTVNVKSGVSSDELRKAIDDMKADLAKKVKERKKKS